MLQGEPTDFAVTVKLQSVQNDLLTPLMPCKELILRVVRCIAPCHKHSNVPKGLTEKKVSWPRCTEVCVVIPCSTLLNRAQVCLKS